MSYKLSFKFQRGHYSGSSTEVANKIESDLKKLLDEKRVISQRFYTASRDSIKVVFPNEGEVNKVLLNTQAYIRTGFEPRMSLGLKSARTVFCAGFDTALLETYSLENIKDQLEGNEWGVKEVYIMRSKKSFKIEMLTTAEAKRFIESTNTSIGGIALPQQTKEQEIDPTIPQCWDCGKLYPNHVGNHCTNTRYCLKCKSTRHRFHQCDIPKDPHQMTPEQKDRQFCIPCNERGDHAVRKPDPGEPSSLGKLKFLWSKLKFSR